MSVPNIGAATLLQEFETVTPTQIVNQFEKDYATSYAVGICLALLEAYGEDDFRKWFPGGLDDCVRVAQQAADKFFDKWKIKWGPKMAWTLKAMGS